MLNVHYPPQGQAHWPGHWLNPPVRDSQALSLRPSILCPLAQSPWPRYAKFLLLYQHLTCFPLCYYWRGKIVKHCHWWLPEPFAHSNIPILYSSPSPVTVTAKCSTRLFPFLLPRLTFTPSKCRTPLLGKGWSLTQFKASARTALTCVVGGFMQRLSQIKYTLSS